MKNLKGFIFILFAIIGTITVFLMFLGFRFIIPENFIMNWDIFGVFTQVLMTVATFAAIYVALKPSMVKPVLHFFMNFSTYSDVSMHNSKPKLFVTNPRNNVLIIKLIKIDRITNRMNDENFPLVYVNLLQDIPEKTQIDIVDGIEFLKLRPIIIQPNQTSIIEFSVLGLLYAFEHFVCNPSDQNKDDKLRVTIISATGEKISLKTEVTFEDYYNTLSSSERDAIDFVKQTN